MLICKDESCFTKEPVVFHDGFQGIMWYFMAVVAQGYLRYFMAVFQKNLWYFMTVCKESCGILWRLLLKGIWGISWRLLIKGTCGISWWFPRNHVIFHDCFQGIMWYFMALLLKGTNFLIVFQCLNLSIQPFQTN